jgi:hypothetical protein
MLVSKYLFYVSFSVVLSSVGTVVEKVLKPVG